MKKTLIGFVMAILVTAAVIGCNAGCAAWGYTPQWWQVAVTLIYILFWGGFTALAAKCRPWLILSRVMGWITLITGIYCLMLRLLQAGGFLSAFLSLFASVPFYGLTLFMDWTALYAVAAVLGLVWVLWTTKLSKR